MKIYKVTKKSRIETLYSLLAAVLIVYSQAAGRALDRAGDGLVWLVDNSDFFAGAVFMAAVLGAIKVWG